ncbi:NAD(P)-dependent oxidoreductase [Legionella sp. km772]|uniref:NAD-dependent epimerase/dehydratase family protein n=1 Tax=Legionella sp. km772 TaxID=2498111 RepID=UPI000F8F2EF8|nr:NAD(P)-dependent oxidoreductase [Legionella sp. km772]RUR12120.1 NAD(P)-dependent oxidoreductase [Legionella sp. km772]
MNILVLGGTGFLGAYVVEFLIKGGKKVSVLTRHPGKKSCPYNPTFIQGDLLNDGAIDFSEYTHVINCAGEVVHEHLMEELHVNSVKRIFATIKQNAYKIHWIQISSVGVYGKVSSGLVVENSPFAPIGVYEKTKAEAELWIKDFCSKNALNYTIIRPSNVFGCGMPNQSLAQLISMINRKLFVYIGYKSEGIVMNYVPVEDVAHLISLCLNNENALNQEFIISDQLALEEFVSLVCKELGIQNKFPKVPEFIIRFMAQFSAFIPKIPLKPSRVDALTRRVQYSTQQASTLLNYVPSLGFSTAMKNYIRSLK